MLSSLRLCVSFRVLIFLIVWWSFWWFPHLYVFTVCSSAWVFSSLLPMIVREVQDKLPRGKAAGACLLVWMLSFPLRVSDYLWHSTVVAAPVGIITARAWNMHPCWLLLSIVWGRGSSPRCSLPINHLHVCLSVCVCPSILVSSVPSCLCPLTLAWSSLLTTTFADVFSFIWFGLWLPSVYSSLPPPPPRCHKFDLVCFQEPADSLFLFSLVLMICICWI